MFASGWCPCLIFCRHNQEVLIETLQQENAKFTESSAMKELRQTVSYWVLSDT